MPIDPLTLGLAAGSLVLGSRLGGRKYDVSGVNKKYVGARPVGWLASEDYAEADRMRGRASRRIGAYGEAGRAGVIRRFAQRGFAGSPAQERGLARVRQEEGALGESAAAASEDFLSKVRRDREAFEREKVLTAWGAELGGFQRQFEQDNARDSAFWNSINDYLPFLVGSFGGGSTAGMADDFVGSFGPGGMVV